MQKSEGVAIRMNKNNIHYLLGNEQLEIKPIPIYDERVCDLLNALSSMLRKDAEAKEYPDIMTFAFWCRKANILNLKQSSSVSHICIGRGLVFHIAPSNVPINFAYTLAFGLLSGNANVVRVSEKEFAQTAIVCRILQELFQQEKYAVLAGQNQVVSYGHDEEINRYYSALCDVRVIWGGDATIAEIRKAPLKPRATEITFADRYSFGVFDETAVERLSGEAVFDMAEKFYNDTYLMDQNACSSPHMIFWLHAMDNGEGRKKFWDALGQVAEKYELAEKKVMDKYTLLCENSAVLPEKTSLRRYGNLLYVVELSKMPEEIEKVRGKFGLFYEKKIDAVEEICNRLSERMQTCVVFGIDKKALAQCFVANSVRGIDRIVQVGQAMDIGVYWDGYDVIRSLSRGMIL